MPRTKVWIEWLERDQTGSEKLATQGFFDGDFEIGRLNQANLADLAGNAVGIPVVEVINQAMMEEFLDVLPKERRVKASWTLRPSSANPPQA